MRPLRSVSLPAIEDAGGDASHSCVSPLGVLGVPALGDVNWASVGAAGAAGGAAGASAGGVGAGPGAAIAAGAELLRQTGMASGVEDPSYGKTNCYLVDHPEARGSLSERHVYEGCFRELRDRAFIDDSLQSTPDGYVPVAPTGQPYPAHFVVPPAAWGVGPYEMWSKRRWAEAGQAYLQAWREAKYAQGAAPSWYVPKGPAWTPEGYRESESGAYGDGYYGDVGPEQTPQPGQPPTGRPQFVPVAAAGGMRAVGETKSSSGRLWLLALLGGGAVLVYFGTRRPRRPRRPRRTRKDKGRR